MKIVSRFLFAFVAVSAVCLAMYGYLAARREARGIEVGALSDMVALGDGLREGMIAAAAESGEARKNLPVIVVTGFGTLETAIATLRAGASDFLTKPFNAEQLVFSLERALRQAALEEEVQRLRRDAGERRSFDEIEGGSIRMQRVFGVIEQDDLPPKIRDYNSSQVLFAGSDPAELVTLDEVERRYIQRVMEAVPSPTGKPDD